MMGQGQDLRTDLELVGSAQGGDRRAFSELVKRHQRGLLRLSLRFVKEMETAEDVVQESFIKAYEKLASFEGRASFKSWLYQIAVNTARNRLRERRHDMADIQTIQVAVGAVAETILVRGAVADLLHTEVEKLPFRQRTALVLRVYEDMSFHEISEVMECPYDTAKANYRHALMKLKQVFETRNDLREWNAESSGFLTEMNQYAEAE